MAIKTVGSQAFEKGWVTVIPAHLLEEGASPNAQNVDFSESFGRLTKRKGHSVLYTAGANSEVCGLHELITSAGTTHILAAANDDVYEVTGSGTWTSVFNAAAMNGVNTSFCTFNDLAIFVNENITTQKWNGAGASSNLLGSPPANVKWVCAHKSRVFMANSSAGASRLHYSASDDGEDWTTADSAGFIDVSPDDGDEITGIVSIGNALLIFKKLSTWVMQGFSPTTFTLKQVSPSVGCVAGKTIIRCDSFAIFLAQDGVYAATPSGVSLLSYNIKPTIDAISDSVKMTACAGKLRTQYWLCIDADGNGENDEVYVLDYVLGVWGRYTNKKEKVFLRRNDGTLISGGDEDDIIRKHDDTDNDSGSAVSMIWDTKDYDFDDWVARKEPHDVIVMAEVLSGKTVTITHLVDGLASATTQSFSLTRAGGYDKVYHTGRGFPTASAGGRFLRLRFSNAESDARVKILGFSLQASVSERQNG